MAINQDLIELKFTKEQVIYLRYLVKKELRYIKDWESDTDITLPESLRITQELDLIVRKP